MDNKIELKSRKIKCPLTEHDRKVFKMLEEHENAEETNEDIFSSMTQEEQIAYIQKENENTRKYAESIGMNIIDVSTKGNNKNGKSSK